MNVMKYAVIKTGGKQYKVSEGDVITVERVATDLGATITFSEVLMLADEGKLTFGQPFITDISVTGKVLENPRGEKLRIAKFKAKARYRRVTGHDKNFQRSKFTN
jgi:large subunit ribosomal protein L21